MYEQTRTVRLKSTEAHKSKNWLDFNKDMI